MSCLLLICISVMPSYVMSVVDMYHCDATSYVMSVVDMYQCDVIVCHVGC